jgi:uroporphyrinogen III methyltransferase/synthase
MQNEAGESRRLFVAVIKNGASEIEEILATAPVEIHAMPVSVIEPCARLDECEKIESEFGAYDWLLFSSANAVKIFFEAIHVNMKQNSPKIACVGPGTRDYLERLGCEVDFVASEHSGETFAREFLSIVSSAKARILVPQPETVAFDLSSVLERGGLEVTRFVIYRTSPIKQTGATDIQWEKTDIFAFMSPSGVKSFSRLYSPPLDADVFTIGPSTAKAAEEVGFKKVRVAKKYSRYGLVDAIVAFLDNAE